MCAVAEVHHPVPHSLCNMTTHTHPTDDHRLENIMTVWDKLRDTWQMRHAFTTADGHVSYQCHTQCERSSTARQNGYMYILVLWPSTFPLPYVSISSGSNFWFLAVVSFNRVHSNKRPRRVLKMLPEEKQIRLHITLPWWPCSVEGICRKLEVKPFHLYPSVTCYEYEQTAIYHLLPWQLPTN